MGPSGPGSPKDKQNTGPQPTSLCCNTPTCVQCIACRCGCNIYPQKKKKKDVDVRDFKNSK